MHGCARWRRQEEGGAHARTCSGAPPQGDGEKLKAMLASTDALGMDAVVEVHNKEELDLAVAAGAKIIGVCNR